MPKRLPGPAQVIVRKALGLRIREIRVSVGMSQEELAHLSGLDRSYVGSVERGERNVRIVNIAAIARGLNAPISDLVTFSEQPDHVRPSR